MIVSSWIRYWDLVIKTLPVFFSSVSEHCKYIHSTEAGCSSSSLLLTLCFPISVESSTSPTMSILHSHAPLRPHAIKSLPSLLLLHHFPTPLSLCIVNQTCVVLIILEFTCEPERPSCLSLVLGIQAYASMSPFLIWVLGTEFRPLCLSSKHVPGGVTSEISSV